MYLPAGTKRETTSVQHNFSSRHIPLKQRQFNVDSTYLWPAGSSPLKMFGIVSEAADCERHIWCRQPSLYRHAIQRQNSLKWQFHCHETVANEVTISLKICKNIVFNTLKKLMFWIFVRIASVRRFWQISKIYVLWVNKNKTRLFLHINLLIKYSVQQQIHFNGKVLGNKCCRCNEGSL